MTAITFNDLPSAVSELNSKLDLVLTRLDIERAKPLTRKKLNINAAAEYTGRTPNALRIAAHRGEIPHYKIRGRLYFFPDELDQWFESGRIRTVEEIRTQAMEHLKEKKG